MEEAGVLPERGEFGRDWTKGNAFRNLLSLGWPMMVTEGLYMLGISIDMVWVGRLGAAAMAGIGVAGIFAGFQMMIMTGLSLGARTLVAAMFVQAVAVAAYFRLGRWKRKRV